MNKLAYRYDKNTLKGKYLYYYPCAYVESAFIETENTVKIKK